MPTQNKLASKKSKRNIGQEILDGIREIKGYKAGKIALRTYTITKSRLPQVI